MTLPPYTTALPIIQWAARSTCRVATLTPLHALKQLILRVTGCTADIPNTLTEPGGAHCGALLT